MTKRTRKTRYYRLREARALVERRRRSVRNAEKRLARAQRSGDAEKIAKAGQSMARVSRWLRAAERRLADEERGAQIAAALARRGLKMQTQIEQTRAWPEQREREAKGKHRNAADRVERKPTVVDSPYGELHGPPGKMQGRDRVERVVHSLEKMRLSQRQRMAADRYRWAYETCPGEIRCALNQSGGGGGSLSTRSPTEDQLAAAERLSEAARFLGQVDGAALRLVCGEGERLEEAARVLGGYPEGRRPPQREIDVAAARVRTGLSVLADCWWPERHRIRSHREAGARPSEMGVGSFDPESFKGKVAHATTGRIFGFEPEGGQPGERLPRRKRGRQSSSG